VETCWIGRVIKTPIFFFLVISLLGPTCFSQQQPQSQTTPQVQEFYRIIHFELDRDGECKAAQEYLDRLSPREQLNVARAIIDDPDARISYFGDSLLIARGHLDETIPSLAAIIASGRDEMQLKGRIGYDWLHSDDELLFLRMLISLSNYFLAHLDKYRSEERSRVEHFLMGGMLNKSPQPFSRKGAQRRVAELERALQKSKAARKSNLMKSRP